MSDAPNTLFLRLEGPLQAWGDNSKFVIRRTMEAPTKSGVIGLICCAMGAKRSAASEHPVPDPFAHLRTLADRLVPKRTEDGTRETRTILGLLNTLMMGVRIDRPGTRWWDYHTVGAGIGMLTAQGKLKTGAQGTLITRREYLCDASFLVALQGDTELIQEVKNAVVNPKWPLFLGRKSCPPSRPILAGETQCDDPAAALRHQPWRPRLERDVPRENGKPRNTIDLDCLVEWRRAHEGDIAPAVWYDAAVSFDPPVHEPRLVQPTCIELPIGKPLQYRTPPPSRPRADYQDPEYRKRRLERLHHDHGLCVFCKSPATTVQHVTYRHAGGDERLDELRSLCRLCHDAVTMIEYGLGMGLDRINPEDPCWRDSIIRKRDEIIEFRSLETRRRRLSPEEV